MAERRMFAKSIIDSDDFLDMPASAQCLYFHLSMRADDEGFVNSPKRIQKIANCADDDFKLLVYKHFIILFECGVCVIKHWHIHNYLQSDRKKPTNYPELKAMLVQKENKAYTLENGLDTECIQNVSKLDAQYSIGKDRVSIGKARTDDARFLEFWQLYPKKAAKAQAEKSFEKINPDRELLDTILKAVEQQKKSKQWLKDEGQFIPMPATWLNQRRWEDVVQIDTKPQLTPQQEEDMRAIFG